MRPACLKYKDQHLPVLYNKQTSRRAETAQFVITPVVSIALLITLLQLKFYWHKNVKCKVSKVLENEMYIYCNIENMAGKVNYSVMCWLVQRVLH